MNILAKLVNTLPYGSLFTYFMRIIYIQNNSILPTFNSLCHPNRINIYFLGILEDKYKLLREKTTIRSYEAKE